MTTRRETVLPARAAPAPPRGIATPMAIGALVARNLVPIIGIVFFGWSAQIVLLLCFADTLLAFAVLTFGLISKFVDDEGGTTPGERARSWAVGLFASAFVTAFMVIPLGVPVVGVVFGGEKASLASIAADPAFRWGLAAQVFTSLLALSAFVGEVKRFPLEHLRIKRRYGLLILRWICVVGVAMTVGMLSGRFGALFLVAVYAAVTVYAELAPSRFLAHFDYREDDVTAGERSRPAGGGAPVHAAAVERARARHGRRHGQR